MSRSSTQPEDQTEIVKRLRSAAGHLRAVTRMVEDNEPCEKALHQLGAVEAALHAIGVRLLDCEVEQRVETILNTACADARAAELERLFPLLLFLPTQKREVNR